MTKGRGWQQQRCNFGRSGRTIKENESCTFRGNGRSISENKRFSKDG
jgi:hypothetical protein